MRGKSRLTTRRPSASLCSQLRRGSVSARGVAGAVAVSEEGGGGGGGGAPPREAPRDATWGAVAWLGSLELHKLLAAALLAPIAQQATPSGDEQYAYCQQLDEEQLRRLLSAEGVLEAQVRTCGFACTCPPGAPSACGCASPQHEVIARGPRGYGRHPNPRSPLPSCSVLRSAGPAPTPADVLTEGALNARPGGIGAGGRLAAGRERAAHAACRDGHLPLRQVCDGGALYPLDGITRCLLPGERLRAHLLAPTRARVAPHCRLFDRRLASRVPRGWCCAGLGGTAAVPPP